MSFLSRPFPDLEHPRALREGALLALLVYNFLAFGLGLLVVVFGYPVDFSAVWGAARLTLDGHPRAAYDSHAITMIQRLAAPAGEHWTLWSYPPSFQLVIAPLGLLPHAVAWCLFVVVSVIAFVGTHQALVKFGSGGRGAATILVLAFPGIALPILMWQNSLISAALFAGAALSMDRRSRVAGVLLGLLAFKPQLGLLVPIALIAGREWRALFTAGTIALFFCILATLFFGVEIWKAFFDRTLELKEYIQSAPHLWPRIPNAYIFSRMLGLSSATAWVIQVVAISAAAASTAFVWRRNGSTPLAFAVLVTATLLALPYGFDYEFALLATPLAIIASDMSRNGGNRTEIIALLFLYTMPLFVTALAKASHFQIGFLAILLAFILSIRRALASAPPAPPGSKAPSIGPNVKGADPPSSRLGSAAS
jgi:alpha-1,2-mannosyltransferase